MQSPLLFQDSGMQRVFTFGPVNRVDQDTVFQCFSGALSSTMSTLNVFCKPLMMYSSHASKCEYVYIGRALIAGAHAYMSVEKHLGHL